jgi:hypothetical protein
VWPAGTTFFPRTFSCIFVRSRQEKYVISYRGQAEPKNVRLLSPWSSAEAIFLRPGQGVNMNLLQGGEGLMRHSF